MVLPLILVHFGVSLQVLETQPVVRDGLAREGILISWYLGILVSWYLGILVSGYLGILVSGILGAW